MSDFRLAWDLPRRGQEQGDIRATFPRSHQLYDVLDDVIRLRRHSRGGGALSSTRHTIESALLDLLQAAREPSTHTSTSLADHLLSSQPPISASRQRCHCISHS